MAHPVKMTKVVKAKVEKMLRAGVPTVKIAAAVKLSVPTIYHHFPGGVRGMRRQVEQEARRSRRRK